MGTHHPTPKRSTAPNFRRMSRPIVAKRHGWIKMPLGTGVGLCSYDIVLYGAQLPPPQEKRGRAPIFGPCQLWPNGRPSQLLLSSSYLSIFKVIFTSILGKWKILFQHTFPKILYLTQKSTLTQLHM